MRNILYTLTLFFTTLSVCGQNFNQLAEGAAKDLKIAPSGLAQFKENYIASLKKEQNSTTIQHKIADITNVCDDGGFETKDFSNWGWTIVNNSHDASGITFKSIITGATGRVKTVTIATDGALIGGVARHANAKWEICSAGFDPLIATMPTVHSGNYALKLGDKPDFSDPADYPWKSAESVQKSITISSTNKILKFWYAVVTNDASSLSSHANGGAAGFGVRVNKTFLPINPVPVGSSNSPIYAYNNPGLESVTVSGRDISYLPWACSSVDLTAYIGQTVTIEFVAFDCIHTGHFAYSYIDDICLGCEETAPSNTCCLNKFSVVSPSAVPASYPYNGGTYSIENFNVSVPNSIPITEIKVNVESFEILSDFKDCLKCDNKPATLGSLFGIRTIGSGANALTLTSQPYGTSGSATTNCNELIWSNPSGVTLNSSDKLGVVYLLPADKEISCCANKAKVCIRISWRDTNCGYCEVFNCSTIDLKNPKDLKVGFQLPDLLTLYLNSRDIFVTGHADGF